MINNVTMPVNIVNIAQVKQYPIIFEKWMKRSYQNRQFFTFRKATRIFQIRKLLEHIRTDNCTTWTNIQNTNSLINEGHFLSV